VITLYYAAHTCSLASHVTLEEAGAEYSTVRINFQADEQRSSRYLAVNPKGRVPAMVTDRGILTETPAILAFIAQNFPQAGLAPLADLFAFAQVQAFNSYLCSTVHGHMRTASAVIDGPTIRLPSKRCSAEYRTPSARVLTLSSRTC
jgi:glutathione S-transferase